MNWTVLFSRPFSCGPCNRQPGSKLWCWKLALTLLQMQPGLGSCKTPRGSRRRLAASLRDASRATLKRQTWGQTPFSESVSSGAFAECTKTEKKKNVHDHHRKKMFWRTFLASRKNFPGRWWIQKPYTNQESHIHHRNLSSVDPIFFLQRNVLNWSRAVYGFFFPAKSHIAVR